ncbi:MAG TPA: isoprenyl transferase [Spirochaetota bacterium]|nr:isoprenyl transferase [Spirochaetota bacterium]HPR39068.1 isoprenyl transferase [Spirochaetota bacterium]HRX47465.1 isoprenyl transferase [Spirochaetota bacterium]
MIFKKDKTKTDAVPYHVGIIMDGNGRWAKQRNLSRGEGHKRGADIIEPVMDCAMDLGIKVVSLYAFSVENWSRPVTEVKGLWELLEYFFSTKLEKIKSKNIQIRHSGSLAKLPPSTKKTILKAIDETKDNSRAVLNFCVNYGGRQEIVKAVNEWTENAKPGEKITEKKLEKYLYTAGLPDPDLLIRTSGEYRISNFLLWQLAYAELYFTDVLWPDFGPEDLQKAVTEFQKRERRYGGL